MKSHGDEKIDREPGYPDDIPTSPIVWPANQHQSNQIQQTKGTAKAQGTHINPSTQPSVPSVQARTTPRKVSNVRVVLRPSVSGQKQITVQFNHPSGDPYFSGASVYLRQAGKQPTLVASGAQSPLTFTAPVSAVPHSVIVQSVGPWGSTNILGSPSHPLRLK